MTVIDAHQHFWDPERVPYDWLGPELAPLNRQIGYSQLEPLLLSAGIDFTVLVQSADNSEDTDYMLEVAAEHPRIAAIVAWVPLEQPAIVASQLPRLMRQPAVVGIRNLIHNQSDPDWLLRPDVDESLGILEDLGVPFDVVSVLPRHLEHVPVLSERHPRLRMVIDHLSKPPIKGQGATTWRRQIAAAAENPLVHAKVSGLYPASGAWDDANVDDVRPYFEHAMNVFGARRLMFGSDWPISILAGGYLRVWKQLSALFDELSSQDRDSILGDTAARFYRIPAERITMGSA